METSIKYAYFIGAGGIGMSALVRYFLHTGAEVHGYDRTRTRLTAQLEQDGLQIHYEERTDLIPEVFLQADDKEVVWVYTPAIPASHKEIQFLLAEGKTLLKRSQLLGMITKQTFNISVGGTHGKTTTTCMLATLLAHLSREQHSFMGGISADLGTNYFHKKGEHPLLTLCEADEFDRSFLQLSPDIAVITSVDADHLDVYGKAEDVQQAYGLFAQQLKSAGVLYCKKGIEAHLPNISGTLITYGLDEGDAYISDLQLLSDGSLFSFCEHGERWENIKLGLPGLHNAENACVAISIAKKMGCTEQHIRDALMHFKGVRRRFERVCSEGETIYIDDYAHHPTEIAAVLSSIRSMYPASKITAIFQPHLYSRTRDFAPEFAAALDLADQVFLMDIYPAREAPIEGVDSGIILRQLTKPAEMLHRALIADRMKALKPELLVTLGAGDIDLEVEKIKQAICTNE